MFCLPQEVLLRGICRTSVALKPISLKAIISLSVRPLISGNFSDNLTTMFLMHILSTPALLHHVESLAPDCLQLLQAHNVLEHSLQILEDEKSMKIITNRIKGTQSLALLANLAHLFHLEPLESATNLGFPTFSVSILAAVLFHSL